MQTSASQRPACTAAAQILHAYSWQTARNRLQSILDNDELCLFVQPIRSIHGHRSYPMAEVLIRLRKEETHLLPSQCPAQLASQRPISNTAPPMVRHRANQ
jgi:hypothetical protein